MPILKSMTTRLSIGKSPVKVDDPPDGFALNCICGKKHDTDGQIGTVYLNKSCYVCKHSFNLHEECARRYVELKQTTKAPKMFDGASFAAIKLYCPLCQSLKCHVCGRLHIGNEPESIRQVCWGKKKPGSLQDEDHNAHWFFSTRKCYPISHVEESFCNNRKGTPQFHVDKSLRINAMDDKLTDINRVSFFSWFLPDVKIYLDGKLSKDQVRRMRGKNFDKIIDPSFFVMSKINFPRCENDALGWRKRMFHLIKEHLLPPYWKEMKTHEVFSSCIGEALQFINFLEDRGVKNHDNILSGTKIFNCSLVALKRIMCFDSIDDSSKIGHVDDEAINLTGKCLNFMLDYYIRERKNSEEEASMENEMPDVIFLSSSIPSKIDGILSGWVKSIDAEKKLKHFSYMFDDPSTWVSIQDFKLWNTFIKYVKKFYLETRMGDLNSKLDKYEHFEQVSHIQTFIYLLLTMSF